MGQSTPSISGASPPPEITACSARFEIQIQTNNSAQEGVFALGFNQQGKNRPAFTR
jgi:hypothetical protein